MKERYTYIAAIILLLGFMFNFAHSELGFMTPEGDVDHHSHDFCQLTSAATAKHNITADSFALKNVQSFFSMVCILPEAAPVSNSMLRQFANLSPGGTCMSDTPLFVINRTLLI